MPYTIEGLPLFNHPEVAELYQKGLRIEAAELQAILNLAKPTLVQDLEHILTDTKQRYEYYKNLCEEELEEAFLISPLHAIMLLGELQSKASLPAILKWLSQPYEAVDFWLSEHKTETIWEALYKLLPSDDKQAIDFFLRDASVNIYSKLALTDAFTQLALHQPQYRTDVLAMYAGLFEYYQATESDDDKEFLSFVVNGAIEMNAVELMLAIERLFDDGIVYSSVLGKKAEALEDLVTKKINHTRKVLPIIERYQNIITTWHGYVHEFDKKGLELENVEEPDDEMDDWEPVKNEAPAQELVPVHTEPKIGRNDPCPCGSGKKYKKCCMNN